MMQQEDFTVKNVQDYLATSGEYSELEKQLGFSLVLTAAFPNEKKVDDDRIVTKADFANALQLAVKESKAFFGNRDEERRIQYDFSQVDAPHTVFSRAKKLLREQYRYLFLEGLSCSKLEQTLVFRARIARTENEYTNQLLRGKFSQLESTDTEFVDLCSQRPYQAVTTESTFYAEQDLFDRASTCALLTKTLQLDHKVDIDPEFAPEAFADASEKLHDQKIADQLAQCVYRTLERNFSLCQKSKPFRIRRNTLDRLFWLMDISVEEEDEEEIDEVL